MFILKKIIGIALFPFSISILLLFFGMMLLWFTKKQKAAKVLLSVGIIFLLAVSTRYVPNVLLKPLELQYPPMTARADMQNLKDERLGVKWIVVLGGGHNSETNVPATSKLSFASMARLTEGIRLHRELPNTKLVLSGGKIMDTLSDAEAMERVAVALGVPERDMVIEGNSLDTEEQALMLQPIVGKARMILVTSAAHMPRAMGLFENQGMHPIPAPTDFALYNRSTMWTFFPNTTSLEQTRIAVYEYLGMLWAKVRGKM